MSINGIENSGLPIGPNPLRSEPAKDANDVPAREQAGNKADRGDRVEISPEARSLAGAAGSTNASETGAIDGVAEEPTVPAHRVHEILARVQEGFYDQRGVQEQIAKRVLPDLGA